MTSKAEEMYQSLNVDNYKDLNIPQGTFEYTLSALMDIKELEPYQIIEYESLCGDSSDNIKGVHGVGPKAVLPLLKEYGNIETIYEMIEDLTEKEQKELSKFFKESLGVSRTPIKYLLAGKESAFVSKKLANIKTDISSIQDVKLSELEVNIDNKILKERLLELEIKSLI